MAKRRKAESMGFEEAANPATDMTRRVFVSGTLATGVGLVVSGLTACTDSDKEGETGEPEGGSPQVPAGGGGLEGADSALAVGEMPVFVVRGVDGTEATSNGVERLISLMENSEAPFFQTALAPQGIIGVDDVVILKINCQWAQRGGTNTDLLAQIVSAILEHPEGFAGEIIVADNGQAQYGSAGRGGSLEWEETNSSDRRRSALDVVNEFRPRARISGSLWDSFTMNEVGEFEEGDLADGFVLDGQTQPTGIEVSYPKFTTEYGSQVSFRRGIWDEASKSYDGRRLKIINLPVLKVHGQYQVTGAVKSYMGTTASRLTGQSSHNSVGNGGMGTQMALTRMPALNIMDMIWLGVARGPGITYENAVKKDIIAASLDPVALDWWCARNVLMPELEARG
ncbi:MAG: DUF362 domain-containing protein, partial [Coriobacteriales bacterium]|nr:DUF362 domain-containing protein [Coriobacteriales bacterium]